MELISKIEGLANVDDVALSLKCDISNPEQVSFGNTTHVTLSKLTAM